MHAFLPRDRAHDGIHDVLQAFERQKRAAERNGGVAGQESSHGSAEGQGTEPLWPSQIDFAAAVDAVERGGELPVGLQQLVAQQKLADAGQVGQLEVVARQRVAQIAHGQEAPIDDAIQDLVDQFLASNPLGRTLREQFDNVQRAVDRRFETSPQVAFGPVSGRLQQRSQPAASAVRELGAREAARGDAQMFRDQNVALTGQHTLERPAAQRDGPVPNVQRINAPFVVDAHLLQIVEHARLGGPNAARRAIEQRNQRSGPFLGFAVAEAEGRLQTAR